MQAVKKPKVGDTIGPTVWRPTTVQLFRFSAVTWNAHRIHFDRTYALKEGYPDVLVQSHLHGAFLAQTVLRWAGPGSSLVRFTWENRHYAIPGDTLTCEGTVTEMQGETLTCELTETNQHGRVCAPGWATVAIASC